MEFCKTYQEYMQGRERKLPWLGLKKLKKILKKCGSDLRCHNGIDGGLDNPTCPDHCPGNLEKKNEKENIFTCFCWYISSLFGLFFWVLVVFPNLDWCLANLLDLNKGGDFFWGEFCMCYLLQNFNMKYCPLHFFFFCFKE